MTHDDVTRNLNASVEHLWKERDDLNRQLAEAKFIDDLLRFCIEHEIADMLFWFSGDGGSPRPHVNANDLFAWACADATEITPDNFATFRQSIEDCEAIDDVLGGIEGCSLFSCRVDKMRPQGAAYPKNRELWPLFDACGPEREIDFGNPCKPGEYKSAPSYQDLQKQLAEAREREAKLTREIDRRGKVLQAAQLWLIAHCGSHRDRRREVRANDKLTEVVEDYAKAALRESEKEADDGSSGV